LRRDRGGVAKVNVDVSLLVVSHLVILLIGIAIGRRRDAKVRIEIARFGAMVIEAMKEKATS
jgi:hypothetical protein